MNQEEKLVCKQKVKKMTEDIPLEDYPVYLDTFRDRITKGGIAPVIVTSQNSGSKFVGVMEEMNTGIEKTLNDTDLEKIEDPQFVDSYNRKIRQDGKAGTIQTGVDFRNKEFVAIPELIGGVGEKKSNGGTQYYQHDRIYSDKMSPCISTTSMPYFDVGKTENKNEEPEVVTKVLRIRKLTPKECGRLLGVADEDIDKMSEHLTPAQMFHCFGDSIVTTCLMGIFGELFDVDYQTKITELIENHIKEDRL